MCVCVCYNGDISIYIYNYMTYTNGNCLKPSMNFVEAQQPMGSEMGGKAESEHF